MVTQKMFQSRHRESRLPLVVGKISDDAHDAGLFQSRHRESRLPLNCGINNLDFQPKTTPLRTSAR